LRILEIFDGDYPWDVRVEKISDSLLEAGHKVRLLSRNRSRRARFETLASGLEVVRLPHTPDILSFPFFGNPLWILATYNQIRRFKPDLILVRDLPLAPMTTALARMTGTPTVADMAEPYPDSLRSQRTFQKASPTDFIVRNPALADIVERWVVKHLDLAMVVCQEAGERLERKGLPPNRWIEVGNTPRLDRFIPRDDGPPDFVTGDNRFTLLFSGLLAGDRGLDVALEALAILEARYPGRFLLVIVGEGPIRGQLESEVRSRSLEGSVHFCGWVDHGRLPNVIKKSDLGLLPFHRCAHIDATLANKLFEYMSLGLPVAVSDSPPMVRVVQETEAGGIFKGGNANSLAELVLSFADDEDRRQECAERGKHAARSKYCWAQDAERMIAALRSFGS
jgi:glycosyltransferase involved in cell wall biosynthesis